MATSILKQTLYPVLEKSLDNKINKDKLRKGIESYLDRNMMQLTKVGPMKMILFLESDKDLVFECIGLSRNTIIDTVKKAKDSFGQTSSVPIFIALTLCVRYFKEKNDKKMARICLSYLVMAMYPSLFYNFWKFDPNEDVMTYTINNLSNKFKIKNDGQLFLSLVNTAELSDTTYEKRLKNCSDDDVNYYINALNTRIRSFLRKIANEYYKNKAENRYMGEETDNNDPDNYRESDSSSFVVERITNAVVGNLMGGPDMTIVNLSAQICQVSRNELRNYMNSVISGDNNKDIKEVINSILQMYLYDDDNDARTIKTNTFIIYCLEAYKKSNTNNKNIIRIKQILDKWMNDAEVYKKTQRLATLNNFRKAMFTFFVYTIKTYS